MKQNKHTVTKVSSVQASWNSAAALAAMLLAKLKEVELSIKLFIRPWLNSESGSVVLNQT